MRKYDQLKKKKNIIIEGINQDVNSFDNISKESKRVADVTDNVLVVLNEIEKNFKQVTKLNKLDISFLMLAIALQCARQYIFTNDKFKLAKSSDGDKLIKGNLKKVTPKAWQDILFGSVPYDAVHKTDRFRDMNLNTGISGASHRYRTLGHDPIIGWIIGPINILSDSVTKNDFITTYKVNDMKLDGFFPGGTIGALDIACQQIEAGTWSLPAAVTKQAIHFGADYFTKQGLPIPVLSTVNEDMAKIILTKYHINTYTVMRGATMSILINSIIESIHTLFYDEVNDLSIDLYKVRSRKILMYSNVIASSSNILYTAISQDISKLDVGGILVTLYRIINDTKFINEIKKEFLEKEFYKIVMGENISFTGGEL
ncbi:hypothetical protein [Clostridium gasigenes]|uniref:Uncharacterized protein n=1 Tax=Clostridium gasigenes TaxID=94869 RepID=A0A7X0VSP8_9CLOT|nr:hypothetical protein [Clostridium gasigenes]MBB6714826.1 hypothetical protein [Clostridium gasigenes]